MELASGLGFVNMVPMDDAALRFEVTLRAISEHVGLRRETTVEAVGVPLWLARLHAALPVGDTVRFSLSGELPVSLDLLLEGAGFSPDNGDLLRLETLPDVVGPNMRTLVCGLNPSPHAAASGVGFSHPGNRFWPAAQTAGLTEVANDPHRALLRDGVGFTDLVKRTTQRADEITTHEFEAGASRLQRLVRWLRPESIVMVGLTGWRQAIDASATAGWQSDLFADTPIYLMPSTSGLNAHETKESLAEHLRVVQDQPPIVDRIA
ncbi:MAG: TDG/mug DNA glycosylase family protein [Acidimicrobiales bacterium]